MSNYYAIAAMSDNRCVGSLGKIPWDLPENFAWFKHKTMGGTLIMGRKTFKSIGKPLPGRQTVVVSHASEIKDVTNCHDLAMLEIARKAFPVNPSPALLQAAAQRGWGYFLPHAAEGVASAVAGE